MFYVLRRNTNQVLGEETSPPAPSGNHLWLLSVFQVALCWEGRSLQPHLRNIQSSGFAISVTMGANYTEWSVVCLWLEMRWPLEVKGCFTQMSGHSWTCAFQSICILTQSFNNSRKQYLNSKVPVALSSAHVIFPWVSVSVK